MPFAGRRSRDEKSKKNKLRLSELWARAHNHELHGLELGGAVPGRNTGNTGCVLNEFVAEVVAARLRPRPHLGALARTFVVADIRQQFLAHRASEAVRPKVLFHLVLEVDENRGGTLVSGFDAEVGDRAANLAVVAVRGCRAEDSRVCGLEARERVRAAVRSLVFARRLAVLARLHAELGEWTADFVFRTHSRVLEAALLGRRQTLLGVGAAVLGRFADLEESVCAGRGGCGVASEAADA